MKKAHVLLLGLLTLPIACEETPPPVTPANPPAMETAAPTVAPKPAEPTPEELKKAAEAAKKAKAKKELEEAWAQLEVDSKAEEARWTKEMHAAAKKLATKKYPTIKAAVSAAQRSNHRKPKSAARDQYRHPVETLDFFGLKPTMSVLEWGPGEGWYTELLAPSLAARGKLFVNIGDVNGPKDVRGTYYAERLKRFLDTAPEAYGKVERIVTTTPVPNLGMEGKLDMVIVCRAMHGMHRNKVLTGFLQEAFKALKPGGVLGVEQHRAKEDADPDQSAKKGYLPEAWLIKTIEEAGFKLDKKSEVNANAKDTKDYPEGVWALPPTLERKDKDRDKMMAIGESDRMTLRFVKPKAAAKKAAPKKAVSKKK
jgi:predicted methyltransferase